MSIGDNNFNIVSRLDNNLIEQQIRLSSIIVAPYESGTYKVIKPFSVSIECLDDNEFLGTFEEAEISFSGDTFTETIDAIKYEVVEIYKLFKSAKKLGPRPQRQLAVLENYVVEKTR